MPLKALVDVQLDDLRGFLDQPGATLRAFRHLSDMKPIVLKLLVGLQDEEDPPRAMVLIDSPYEDGESFCAAVLERLVTENESHRESLAAEEVDLPRSPEPEEESPVVSLARYLSEVAESFRGLGAAYALIIDPQSIADPLAFADTMAKLANETTSEGVKLVVLDPMDAPRLPGIELRTERADVQVFQLGPSEIEQQVKLDLDAGLLEPPELRQYLMMAGAFAAARGDHLAAMAFQSRAVEESEQAGEPAEHAQGLYNLGTSQLESGDLEAAEASFARAAEICIDFELDALLAMVMINLGVTQHRSREVEAALDAFDVARSTFRALENRPGEAYALDNRAAVLAAEERGDEAEECWLEELEIYDGITNEAMEELRASGREDVVAKLTRFYDDTGQTGKIRALEQGRDTT